MAKNLTLVPSASALHSFNEDGKDSFVGGGTQGVDAHSWGVLF